MNKEEAIKIVRSHYPANKQMLNEALEFLIPELKEDENEKIRKEIISVFKGQIAFTSEEDAKKYIAWLEKQVSPEDKGEISDGYHTFNELYYYRMLYNAAFFNSLPKVWVHKSKKHHDGEECFGGGWFIVMANLPTGQISNHYELKDWGLFQIPEKEVADEWDGHTPKEAAERLHKYLLEKQDEQKSKNESTDTCDSLIIKTKEFPASEKRDFEYFSKSATEAIKEENVDNANKVEPEFKVDDWVIGEVTKYKPMQIAEILKEGYKTTSGEYIGFSFEKSMHLWSIKDAKNGDAICYQDEISLYNHDIKNCTKQETTFGGFVYHCCYDGKRFIKDSFYSLTEQDKINIHPATKEQHNTLMKAMKNAGYEWDSVNKELKEIEQSPIDDTDEIANLKVGDYIVRKDSKNFHDNRKFAQIIEIDGIICQLDNGRWLYDYEIRPWNLSDAKDGDILVTAENKPFIYNGWYNEANVGAYCGIDINNDFVTAENKYSWTMNKDIRPAAKEQSDLLSQKLKETGYGIGCR